MNLGWRGSLAASERLAGLTMVVLQVVAAMSVGEGCSSASVGEDWSGAVEASASAYVEAPASVWEQPVETSLLVWVLAVWSSRLRTLA